MAKFYRVDHAPHYSKEELEENRNKLISMLTKKYGEKEVNKYYIEDGVFDIDKWGSDHPEWFKSYRYNKETWGKPVTAAKNILLSTKTAAKRRWAGMTPENKTEYVSLIAKTENPAKKQRLLNQYKDLFEPQHLNILKLQKGLAGLPKPKFEVPAKEEIKQSFIKG